jgi:hypothetical protein
MRLSEEKTYQATESFLGRGKIARNHKRLEILLAEQADLRVFGLTANPAYRAAHQFCRANYSI